jgi:tetratricopeptide (TPR) repeat protein
MNRFGKRSITTQRNEEIATKRSNRIRLVSAILGLFIAIGAAAQLIARKDADMASAGTARVTDCDRLTAHPSDTQKLAPGIVQAEVDIPRARAACELAYKQAPNDGRILYQLGRTYFYDKQYETGIGYFKQSDAAGYAQGQFVLGLILVQGNGTEPDTCAGGELWMKAARQRHLYSKIFLANNWIDDMFAECNLAITDQEIDGMVSAAQELADTEQQREDVANMRKNWETRKR